MSFDVTWLNNL